jgi:uncharacterized protein (DUF2164 family)
MKRKWDVSSPEIRKKCADEIIAYVSEHQDSELGILAAEEIMNLVAQNIGPDIYNLALKDATKILQTHFSDIETDLDLLNHQS